MKKLGEILLEEGLIDTGKLEAALQYKQEKDTRLGEALIDMNYLSESDLIASLIKQEFLKAGDKKHRLGELRRFLREFVFDKKRAIVSLLLMIFLLIVVQAVQPYVYRFLTDNVIPSSNKSFLLNLSLIYLAFFMVSVFASTKLSGFSQKFTQNVLLGLREKLLSHLSRLPIRFFVRAHVGDIVSRFTSNAGSMSEFTGAYFMNLIRNSIYISVALLLMLNISIPLTLLSVALIAGTLVLPAKIGLRSFRYYDKEAVLYGDIGAFLGECANAYEQVKIFNLYNYQQKRWQGYVKQLLHYNFRLQFVWSAAFIAKESVNYISRILIVFGGTYLALNHVISAGQMITFYILTEMLHFPMNRFYEFFVGDIMRAKPEWKRIEYLFNQIPEKESRSGVEIHETANKISVNKVSFSYGKKKIIDNLSVVFQRGLNVIVGESGEGKSTLFTLLSRLYTPDKGRILWNEIDISQIGRRSFYDKTVFLTQKSYLFPMSLKDNIAFADYGGIYDPEKLQNAIQSAEIADLIERREEMAMFDPSKFSGGEKQRIALARALYSEPDVLLLDEPTRSIDTHSEEKIWHALSSIAKDRMIIMVTHNLHFIDRSDRIYFMKAGKIRESGSFRYLIERQGEFYRLYTEKKIKGGDNA